MYKKVSRLKLRWETSKGSLTVEQLWDLPQSNIATIVRSLKKKINKNNDDELAFLDDTVTQVDEETQLKFDIVKDIYLTRKAEIDAAKVEAEKKAHNQKILEMIKKKQDSELEGKSVEELEALLK